MSLLLDVVCSVVPEHQANVPRPGGRLCIVLPGAAFRKKQMLCAMVLIIDHVFGASVVFFWDASREESFKFLIFADSKSICLFFCSN